MTRMGGSIAGWLALLLVLGNGGPARAAPRPAPMLVPVEGPGFAVDVLLATGERLGSYQPPGVMDGLAAFSRPDGTVQVFATHELDGDQGYPFRLDNGTELTGSRISVFDLDPASRRLTGGAPAIRRVVDRSGRTVVAASQVSERPGSGSRGFEALCSAAGYRAGDLGFTDDVVFVHEEVSAREGHPHGGSVWALDVATGTLHALPALGRGSWENSVALATPDAARPDGHVALLLGDDLEFGGAPLYLWIGRRVPGGDFAARNGLVEGALHAWVADNGDREPADWQGTGSRRTGRFVPVATRDPARAGQPGHDAAGWLDDLALRARARALGAFRFSRPEDLAADPADRRRAVFASTGHGLAFPADEWGGLYVVDARFTADAKGRLAATGTLTLLYDANETRAAGIRSPDNLDWARNGRIYVQEDKAVKRADFTGPGGPEASLWELDPARPREPRRIALIDRAAVPAGATDAKPGVPGEWESSGVLDVSALLGAPGETVLLATVQAHTVRDGPVGGRAALVQASQLLLLSRRGAADR